MKWVKANAAAVGVVDRVGQQVVNIYYHGSNKNQVGDLPLSAEHFIAELLVTKQYANKQCGN